MIHFLDASVQFAAVRNPILLPVAACATPSRSPVRLAHEDLLAVEALESRTIGIGVRPVSVVSIPLNVISPAAVADTPVLPRLLFSRLLFCCGRTQGHNAGIELYDEEEPEVGGYHRQKEHEIQDEKCGGGA